MAAARVISHVTSPLFTPALASRLVDIFVEMFNAVLLNSYGDSPTEPFFHIIRSLHVAARSVARQCQHGAQSEACLLAAIRLLVVVHCKACERHLLQTETAATSEFLEAAAALVLQLICDLIPIIQPGRVVYQEYGPKAMELCMSFASVNLLRLSLNCIFEFIDTVEGPKNEASLKTMLDKDWFDLCLLISHKQELPRAYEASKEQISSEGRWIWNCVDTLYPLISQEGETLLIVFL